MIAETRSCRSARSSRAPGRGSWRRTSRAARARRARDRRSPRRTASLRAARSARSPRGRVRRARCRSGLAREHPRTTVSAPRATLRAQATSRTTPSTISAAPDPEREPDAQHRGMGRQPRLAAREDRGRALAGDDRRCRPGPRRAPSRCRCRRPRATASPTSPNVASLTDAIARSVSTSRFGPPNPSRPAIENAAAGPTWLSPARIALARPPSISGRRAARGARAGRASDQARPRSSVTTASIASWASSRSTVASPTSRPRPHASAVPSRNPLRNAMPFVRGRSLADDDERRGQDERAGRGATA